MCLHSQILVTTIHLIVVSVPDLHFIHSFIFSFSFLSHYSLSLFFLFLFSFLPDSVFFLIFVSFIWTLSEKLISNFPSFLPLIDLNQAFLSLFLLSLFLTLSFFSRREKFSFRFIVSFFEFFHSRHFSHSFKLKDSQP